MVLANLEKYLEFLMSKFALLEHELRVKQFEIVNVTYEKLNEKKHKSR